MDAAIGAISLVGGAIVVWLSVWKGLIPLYRWVRACGARIERAFEILLGVPEMPDPDRPGVMLRPAIPDLGVRMAKVEYSTERSEFHMGNGNPIPLRTIVENNDKVLKAQGRVLTQHTKTLKEQTQILATINTSTQETP